MVLYVDDRENDKLKHELIARLGDKAHEASGQVHVKRLPHGDYILGDWAIEAKEINDLYRSIMGIGRNGRTVNHQLRELVETGKTAYVVVYGNKLNPYFRGRVSNKRIQQEIAKMSRVIKSWKMTFYLRHPQVRFMQFATMNDFVEWLIVNHTRLQQESRLAVTDDVRKARKASDDPRIVALSALPGVTERIAIDLLNTFGSIPNMLKKKTRQRELMEVRGIGRVMSKRILSMRDSYEEEEV